MDDDDVDDVDDDHDDFLEQTFGYGGAEACVGYDDLITGLVIGLGRNQYAG